MLSTKVGCCLSGTLPIVCSCAITPTTSSSNFRLSMGVPKFSCRTVLSTTKHRLHGCDTRLFHVISKNNRHQAIQNWNSRCVLEEDGDDQQSSNSSLSSSTETSSSPPPLSVEHQMSAPFSSGEEEIGSSFSSSSSGEEVQFSDSEHSSELKPQFDLNLPRRSLLVEFTCDACGTRTQRKINPYAYKRGTIFIQCAGCAAYHQLVDNLNLIEEYDFREDASSKASVDPVSEA
ncbi:unnamed protein product [Sphagnum jensenii]|uniref:DNL-type domain-containing protein n=2 Tax=Sphagnum jensenii TaxID=128206 RepID=A0ABP0VIT5_9BRYO